MKEKNNEKIINKKKQQNLRVVIFLSVVFLAVLNSMIFYTRFDLTENKEYSISKMSKSIVQDVSDTIYIDYFISSQLKTAIPEAQRIIDILQEYQSRSSGKVVFMEKDAEKPQFAGDLQKYELENQQIRVVKENQATFSVVYSGIVITYQDQTKVIPFFMDPSVIEYQITSKIQEMINKKNRIAGILVLNPAYKPPQSLEALRGTLEKGYEVRDIDVDKAISDDVDVLFVVGSKDINNDTAYYIDQFLMKGGGVYFATERANVDLSQGLQGQYEETLMHKILKHYGVTVEDTLVLDMYNKRIPVNQNNGMQLLQPYPMWVTVGNEGVNKKSPITTRFSGFDLYWTSPLTVDSSRKDDFTTLISSSEESWTKEYTEVPASEESNSEEAETVKYYEMTPNEMGFLLDKKEDNTKSYPLTVSFFGSLTSAVEGGIISVPDGENENYTKSSGSSRFLTTGSSMFLSWLYQYTNAGYNFDFISNATEWLGNDEKLLQIKSRTVKDVRLSKIQDPIKKNALALVVQIWNMILIPLAIIVTAVVMLMLRRRMMNRKYGN